MLASVLGTVVRARSDQLKPFPYPQGRAQINGEGRSMDRKTNSKESDWFYNKKRHRCQRHQRVDVFPTTRQD